MNLLSHEAITGPWTIFVCPACGRVHRPRSPEGRSEPRPDSMCIHDDAYMEPESVEVVPVQPAGPDTIERVARAMCEADAKFDGWGDAPWDEIGEMAQSAWKREAEYVVAAVGPVGRPEDPAHAEFAAHEVSTLAGRLERDRREPDKVLCYVADLKRLATELEMRAERVGRSCEVTDEMAEGIARWAWNLRTTDDFDYLPEAMRRAEIADARAALKAALRTTAPDGEG